MTSSSVVGAAGGAPAPVSARPPSATATTALAAGPIAGRPAGPRVPFRTFLERASESARAEPSGVAPSQPAHARSPSIATGESPADVARALDGPDDRDELRARFRSSAHDASVGSGWPVPPAPPVPLAPIRPELEPAIAAARVAPSLEHLMTALVRRVAWSGDGRRGSARLEIGAGALAGATLVVHADEGRVRVHLDVPPGVDANAWRERIARGLAARRIPADAVDVT